jgi:hypothetical protein
MRLLIAATVAASLFATDLLAAETAAPLPAGNAAGVKAAQFTNDDTLYIFVGAAAIAAILVFTHGGSSKNLATTPAATTTTST